MIATLIVVGWMALATAFAVAWWLVPGLRRAVEAPKHSFAARATQYDQNIRTTCVERQTDQR